MIEGVDVKELLKNVDERGFFTELLREDWKDLLKGDRLTQLNLSYSYPGIVRAWHRHLRGQNDYFMCIDGAVKVCAYDDRPDSKTCGELDEIILSSERLSIARIPGILWHGYQVISPQPVRLLYSVNLLYDRNNPDEERRAWNDEKIIPKNINGKINDPRSGKHWDWYYSPNR